MSFTLTARMTLDYAHGGVQNTIPKSMSVGTITKTSGDHYETDSTGWDLIYDASQTTVLPIGNDDPGDAPYFAWFFVNSKALRLRITDSNGGLTFIDLAEGAFWTLPTDTFGATSGSRIEQIDVQAATSGETSKFEYKIFRD